MTGFASELENGTSLPARWSNALGPWIVLGIGPEEAEGSGGGCSVCLGDRHRAWNFVGAPEMVGAETQLEVW